MITNYKKGILEVVAFVLFFFIFASVFSYFSDNFMGDFLELNLLNRALDGGVNIIYFGDSVVKIADSYGLKELLVRMTGEEKILILAHEAYNLKVYNAFTNYILESKTKPRYIIVPINLRSFSPEWEPRPEYQFQREISRLSAPNYLPGRIMDKFDAIFVDGTSTSSFLKSSWLDTSVYFGDKSIGKVSEFNYSIIGDENNLDDKIKGKFIYQYAHHLDENNALVASMRNMIKNCKKSGVGIIIYLTPIDYSFGKKYAGEEFEKVIVRNKDVILNVGREEGVDIIDMSFDLNHEDFDYSFVPNEHLKKAGVEYISAKIAEKIRSFETFTE